MAVKMELRMEMKRESGVEVATEMEVMNKSGRGVTMAEMEMEIVLKMQQVTELQMDVEVIVKYALYQKV
jgi:hypothetical protein